MADKKVGESDNEKVVDTVAKMVEKTVDPMVLPKVGG